MDSRFKTGKQLLDIKPLDLTSKIHNVQLPPILHLDSRELDSFFPKASRMLVLSFSLLRRGSETEVWTDRTPCEIAPGELCWEGATKHRERTGNRWKVGKLRWEKASMQWVRTGNAWQIAR